MAKCGVCEKELPVKREFKVYTFIARWSSVGGRSTLQEKSQMVGFQEHTYPVCTKCVKKYGNIIPLLFYIPAILFAIYAIVDMFLISKQGFTYLCIGSIVVLIVAYKVTGCILFDIERMLISKAVRERNKTNWRSEIANLPMLQLFLNARTGAEIRGVDESKYKEIMNYNSGNN